VRRLPRAAREPDVRGWRPRTPRAARGRWLPRRQRRLLGAVGRVSRSRPSTVTARGPSASLCPRGSSGGSSPFHALTTVLVHSSPACPDSPRSSPSRSRSPAAT
jgi:hypothetical protein